MTPSKARAGWKLAAMRIVMIAVSVAGFHLPVFGQTSDELEKAQGNQVDSAKENLIISSLSEAIRLNPKNAVSYNDRGAAFEIEGKHDEAILDFNQAIQLNPKYAKAYSNRGHVYKNKGNYDKAIEDFECAIQLNPNYVKAYVNRGTTYGIKGSYDKAIADFNQAIFLNPKYANAYCNRGFIYQNRGQYGNAIADFNHAIQLDPEYVDAYNNLAWLWATCPQTGFRDGKKALENATKAGELSEWKNSGVIDTLAAAYAEAGDFDKAVQQESRFLETPNLSVSDAAGAKNRLTLYQAHQAYHTNEATNAGKMPTQR